jgi:hypothetical protein
MEIFREFYPSFSVGVVVGMIIILAACAYVLIKSDKEIERLEKSKNIERKECARLTEENQFLRDANQKIAKENYDAGFAAGKKVINTPKFDKKYLTDEVTA